MIVDLGAKKETVYLTCLDTIGHNRVPIGKCDKCDFKCDIYKRHKITPLISLIAEYGNLCFNAGVHERESDHQIKADEAADHLKKTVNSIISFIYDEN